MAPIPSAHRTPQDQDAVAQGLRLIKRRAQRRLFLKLLLVLFVVLLGGLFYLQSANALRHFYLPALSRRLGARVTAESGSLGLGGTAHLLSMEIQGTDGTPALRADGVTLRVAPLSLLFGRNAVIHEVTIENPQAKMVVAADGRTNWDFLMPPKPVKVAAASAPVRPAAPRKDPPTLSIEKLALTKAAFQMTNAQQLDLTLTDVDLKVEDFTPGKDGRFGLTAEGYLDRPGIHHRFSTQSNGSLTQDAAGREFGWKGILETTLVPETKAGTTTQTVTMKADLAGTANPRAGRMTHQFTLTASTPRGPAGVFKGKVEWDPAKKLRQAAIDASRVEKELINPILALLGPVQLVRSQLSGNCQVQGAGDLVKIDTQLTGNDLAFQVGADQTQTPPVNMIFVQHGAFNTDRELLKLDAAALTLEQGGRPLLQTQLDQPVELQVGQNSAAAAAGVSAHINTTLNALPVEALQPWLVLAGVKEAQSLREGVLSGQILSVVENAGATIAMDGTIHGTGMILPQWKNRVLEVNQTLKGRLDRLEVLTIDAAKTTLSDAGKVLADVDTLGRFKLTTGEGQATVRMLCPQAGETVRALGLLGAGKVGMQPDGRLESVENLTLAGKGKPATVSGTANLAGAMLTGQGGTLPLAGKVDYQFTVNDRTLDLTTLKAAWNTDGTGAGSTLEAKGGWPLVAGQRGELKLTARGVNLAPWLKLTGQSGPAGGAQTLPLEADETLVAPGDGANKLNGEIRLGPIPAARGADAMDLPVSIKITHSLDKLDDAVRSLAMEMAARTRKGVEDKIVLSGKGTMGPKAVELRLVGKVSALHADGYLALLGLMPGGAPATGKQAARMEPDVMVAEGATDSPATKRSVKPVKRATPAPQKAKQPAPAATPNPPSATPKALATPAATTKKAGPTPAKPQTAAAPAILIEITPLEIEKLVYQRGELTGAKGSLRYENGISEFKLDQGKVCGGTVAGNASFDAAKAEPRYAWEVALKQVDVQPLLTMAWPGMASHFTGKGDIASSGSGQGTGAAAQRRLQSESGFVMANGEVRDYFLLDALADQTRISNFKTLKFSEFSGRVSVADGVATLKDWVERGPEQRISLEGSVKLDGHYDLAFQPAVSKAIAGKMLKDKNDIASQLLSEANGFLSFGQVLVTGQGTQYQVSAKLALGKEAKEQLGENLGRVLQGLAEQKLNKQKDKSKKKDAPGPAPEENKTSGQTKSPDGTLTKKPAEDTQDLSKDKSSGGGLDNLLGQGLQKLQERQKKKDKKRKSQE